MNAIAIYSPTTIEVLPLHGQIWKLGVYSSEALREKVLAEQGFDLSLIADLGACEVRSMMILFDYVVSSYQWNSKFQRRLHRAMRCIAKTYGEQALPPAFFLQGVTIDEPQVHLGGGGYSDTFKGKYGKRVVCLKVPRIFVESDVKAFLDEAIIWRQLKHPNVLPFLGISQTAQPGRTCFVSPFMTNGNLNKFLLKHPSHDRVSVVSHKFHYYEGSAKGLISVALPGY